MRKPLIISVALIGIAMFSYLQWKDILTPEKATIAEVASNGAAPYIATNLGISELYVNNQNFGYPVEITPMVHTQGAGKPLLYMLSSGWSWLCQNTGNILNSSPSNPINFNSAGCKLVTKMDVVRSLMSNGQPEYLPPQTPSLTQTPWRMTYDGPLGLHIINNNRIVAIRHGENQNSYMGGYKYQNTVFPHVSVNTCAARYVNGKYQHCGESFSTYANLGWANYNPNTGWNKENWNDEGPVLWPPSPLVHKNADGTRGTAGGSYHTTTYLNNADGYMYAYTIGSPGTEAGHNQCNIVARSPVSSNLLPGTWKYYYNGSFNSDALPAGFTKERINEFYGVPAGRASCIFPNTKTVAHLYFNVAKVKNTPYFIGVEESMPQNSSWRMGIRFSTDLVNWSDIQVLSNAANWGHGQQFSYPTFYSKDGTSNHEIDLDEFYIVGNAADEANGYKLYKMKLTLLTPQYMYYYRTANNTCSPTANTYLPNQLSACGSNLLQYVPGQTHNTCYTTLASCKDTHPTASIIPAPSVPAASPLPSPPSEQTMYFYHTANKTCAATNSTYLLTQIAECQANLNTYLPGKTTGVCYTTIAACQSAHPTPAPSTSSGQPMYYFHTTRNECIATESPYSSTATCSSNILQHVTGQTHAGCFTTLAACQTANPVAAPMYFYSTVNKVCAVTTDSYLPTDKSRCQNNLNTYLPGKTSGVCYTTLAACQTTNPTASTPTAPAPIPGDFTDANDTPTDQVNIFDYNKLIGSFGSPYTIFDYSSLVSNFNK